MKYFIKKNYFKKKLKEFTDHATRNSFKLFQLNERDRRDVDEQSKHNKCAFNKFCENQNENELENEQDKKIL